MFFFRPFRPLPSFAILISSFFPPLFSLLRSSHSIRLRVWGVLLAPLSRVRTTFAATRHVPWALNNQKCVGGRGLRNRTFAAAIGWIWGHFAQAGQRVGKGEERIFFCRIELSEPTHCWGYSTVTWNMILSTERHPGIFLVIQFWRLIVGRCLRMRKTRRRWYIRFFRPVECRRRRRSAFRQLRR